MSVSCFWSFFQLYELSTLEEGRWGICKNSVPFCNFPLSLKLLQKKTLNKLLFTVITVNKFLLQNRKPRRPYQWLTSQQENLWHFLYLGTRKDRISRHSTFSQQDFGSWLLFIFPRHWNILTIKQGKQSTYSGSNCEIYLLPVTVTEKWNLKKND